MSKEKTTFFAIMCYIYYTVRCRLVTSSFPVIISAVLRTLNLCRAVSHTLIHTDGLPNLSNCIVGWNCMILMYLIHWRTSIPWALEWVMKWANGWEPYVQCERYEQASEHRSKWLSTLCVNFKVILPTVSSFFKWRIHYIFYVLYILYIS